jgi:hypothetical protein
MTNYGAELEMQHKVSRHSVPGSFQLLAFGNQHCLLTYWVEQAPVILLHSSPVTGWQQQMGHVRTAAAWASGLLLLVHGSERV